MKINFRDSKQFLEITAQRKKGNSKVLSSALSRFHFRGQFSPTNRIRPFLNSLQPVNFVRRDVSNKLPAIQFYPGDWKKDLGVQSLNYEERGIWFEILLLMHESEDRGKLLLNGRKIPIEILAQILHLDDNKTLTIYNKLITSGVASVYQDSGVLYCRRMVRKELEMKQLSIDRAEAGRKGMAKRWGKKYTKPITKITASTSISSSSSITSSIKNNKEDELFFSHEWFSKEEFKKSFDDFAEMRKSIKKPMSAEARKRIFCELIKCDFKSALAMLNKSIMNGWAGVFPIREFDKPKMVDCI